MAGIPLVVDSRRKGSKAELDLVHYLRIGWPSAERRLLGIAGPDIVGTPDIAWEMKNAARHQLAAWVDQADRQRAALGATYGPLIIKRRQTSDVGRWYAVLPLDQLVALLAEAGRTETP
jgi:hypothetical protein